MKCIDCEHYKTAPNWNACAITGSECFMPIDGCTLINNDGTVNFKDPYFENFDMPELMEVE